MWCSEMEVSVILAAAVLLAIEELLSSSETRLPLLSFDDLIIGTKE